MPGSGVVGGALESGEARWVGDYQEAASFQIQLDEAMPQPYTVPLTFTLRDDLGGVWSTAFDLEVLATGAAVVFQQLAIVSDDNGDSKANKGESVWFNVQLRNAGTSIRW